MTTIEEPLVPIYMYQRYAVEAAAASLGGQDFVYAMRGDGQTPTRWETAAKQRQALDALAATLAPAELTIPRRLLSLIPPRPFTYGIHRELFPRTTGQAFDPVSPATIAADVTIGFMLEPDRAARLVAQHALDPALPGLEDVVDRLAAATFGATAPTPYEAEVRRATERVFVDRLSWLAVAAGNPQVRAVASLKLQRLAARWRTAGAAKSDADVALHTQLAADVRRLLERPAEAFKALPAAPAPPGAPIGDEAPDWLARPAYAISSER